MSLNGTLETFALPDVLALLSATKKTGELQVNGGRGAARVWLDKGEMVGADVPRATTFVDALFEMLRLTSGNFAFDNDGTPASPSDPKPIEPLLQEAQSRLGEWKSIEAVVPSLACAVKLAAEVSGAQVSITAEQWRALVAVAMNPDVEGVMGALGLGEFDSCRMLKDLVQIGLVSVEDAPPAGAKAANQSAEPVAQVAQATEAPAPAPAAVDVDEPAPEPERPTFKAPVNERAPFKPPASDRPAFQPPSAPASSPPPPSRVSGSTLVAAARSHGGDEKSDATGPASKAPRTPADGEIVVADIDEVAPARTSSAASARRSPASDTGADRDGPAEPTAASARRSPATAAKSTAKAPAPAANEQDDDDLTPAELVHQLAALQGDAPPPSRRPAGGAPAAPAAASPSPPVSPETDDDAPHEAPAKDEEPLNRGLLLKFLNSVRS